MTLEANQVIQQNHKIIVFCHVIRYSDPVVFW